ncbi:MAG: hypothetical protein ACREQY_20105 [Candidatus Binatia bacterium]
MKLSTTLRTFLTLALATGVAAATICPAQCLTGEVLPESDRPCHEPKAPVDATDHGGCCPEVVLAKAPSPDLARWHDLLASAAPAVVATGHFGTLEPPRSRTLLREHPPALFLHHRVLLI